MTTPLAPTYECLIGVPMKKTSRMAKAQDRTPQRREKTAPPGNAGRPQLSPRAKQASPWRWPVIALAVLLTAGGTWAAFEFLVWSRIPAELVGKWVVQGGPQDGATFDFSRNGTLEARFNGGSVEHILKGRAAVEDKRLLITTRNPNTKQDETRSCVIRELSERTFVVDFEQGEVFKMVRAH